MTEAASLQLDNADLPITNAARTKPDIVVKIFCTVVAGLAVLGTLMVPYFFSDQVTSFDFSRVPLDYMITRGGRMISPNRTSRLLVNSEGYLVITRDSQEIYRAKEPCDVLAFQINGDLVCWLDGSGALYNTNTHIDEDGSGIGYELYLPDSGDLTILNQAGQPLWHLHDGFIYN